MGKKRRLLLVQVGEGPSRSQQRGEENLEATYTAPQARADARDAGTAPLGMQRESPLTVVEVGEGLSRSQQSVHEELRAALVADQAIGDASNDDETQLSSPENLVQQTQETSNVRVEDLGQETPRSSNGTKKRGRTLMRKIWTLPSDKKIELPLNAACQPLGESGQTFIRWLGTFCLCPAYCPLMPLNWTHVPSNHKEDAWIEIQKKWIINPEIIHPANQMTWAMHLLGELRRNRRTKLKKKCYPKDASKEEVLAKVPRWADAQQYAELVDYWFHPDTQAKESGQAVERAVVFTKVYSKKDGTPVSTDVEDKIKMAKISNSGGSLEGEYHQGILWSKIDAFAQVMRKECCGRVQGVGFGPTPSVRSGSNLPCYTSTPPSFSETAQRMTDLENSLRDELARSEQRHQEQIANMHAQHKEEITELHARHKVEITKAVDDAMRNILDQLQPFLNTLSVSQSNAPLQCLR